MKTTHSLSLSHFFLLFTLSTLYPEIKVSRYLERAQDSPMGNRFIYLLFFFFPSSFYFFFSFKTVNQHPMEIMNQLGRHRVPSVAG